jgi:CBS domain-containing protein
LRRLRNQKASVAVNNLTPTIDDYMARQLTTFRPGDDIHMACRELISRRYSGAPVVDDDGNLVGMLSKKDCLKVVYSASYHQDRGGCVADFMSRKVQTIASGTGIAAAADIFIASHYRRFPVVDNGRLVGQISRGDLLQALVSQ